MRKSVNFPPYQTVEICMVHADGSFLCNLHGEGISDYNIVFPADTALFTVTDQEMALLEKEQPSDNLTEE